MMQNKQLIFILIIIVTGIFLTFRSHISTSILIFNRFINPISNEQKLLKSITVNNLHDKINFLEDGCYYITHSICIPCKNGRIFEDLEGICLRRGTKLKLVLLGVWTEIEKANILIERGFNIEIDESPLLSEISNYLDQVLPSREISLVLVKNKQRIINFVISSEITFNKWQNIKQRILDELK